MDRTLAVTVLKDGAPFLQGRFDVASDDYEAVRAVLAEVSMDREQAASLLGGYMHARDVGPVTEEMGKIALIATVFMLEAGESEIEISL